MTEELRRLEYQRKNGLYLRKSDRGNLAPGEGKEQTRRKNLRVTTLLGRKVALLEKEAKVTRHKHVTRLSQIRDLQRSIRAPVSGSFEAFEQEFSLSLSSAPPGGENGKDDRKSSNRKPSNSPPPHPLGYSWETEEDREEKKKKKKESRSARSRRQLESLCG